MEGGITRNWRKGNPMKLNFVSLEIEKSNIPTDRAQRVDEKNGVICLFIMFTPRVIVIKMSKMAHFLYFLLMAAKTSHNLRKVFGCIWKILLSSIRKCYGLLGSELPLARYQPLKIDNFDTFYWLGSFFDISILNISRTVTSEPINHTIF